ncbi:MAG: GC-type dockerin domain-anchored protein [Phycisphaerales bacterium]
MKNTINAAAAVLVASGLAFAVPIPVTNFGFEANVIPVNTFAALIPQGWQVYDPSGIIDQANDAVGVIRPTNISFFPSGTTEGDNAALLFFAGDVGGGEAGLAQTVAATLQPGNRYTLRVDVGNIASGTSVPPNAVQFFNLDGFPGYRVDLLAGGVVIASDNNTLASSIPEGEWRESVVTFDAPPGHPLLGTPLRIRLVNLNIPGTAQAPGIEVDFDNVRLDASPTPPPVCVGDLNSDGVVNTADLVTFLGLFGQVVTPGAPGDFNSDGQINTTDLVTFLGRFGVPCP